MSDRWYYRIFGQEFGPVSLDLVRTLVTSGTIAPDDEVRDATRSNWLLACAASELRDSIKTREVEPSNERRSVRDEWFCRGASGDFGPLTLSDLIRLAAEGELKPDEDVKSRADDYWKQVCSIRRLVELLPFPNHSQGAVTDSDDLEANRLHLYGAVDEANIEIVNDTAKMSESDSGRQPSANSSDGPPEANFDQTANRCEATDQNLISECDQDFEMNILPFPRIRPVDQAELKEFEMERQTTESSGFRKSASETPVAIESSFASMINPPKLPASVFANPDALSSIDEDESMTAFDQFEAAMSPVEVKWTGWISGVEFGPVDYSELLTWAVTGRLSPMDFVRRGEEGLYVPAVNIPCLFTVRAAASSLSRRVVPKTIMESTSNDSKI